MPQLMRKAAPSHSNREARESVLEPPKDDDTTPADRCLDRGGNAPCPVCARWRARWSSRTPTAAVHMSFAQSSQHKDSRGTPAEVFVHATRLLHSWGSDCLSSGAQ